MASDPRVSLINAIYLIARHDDDWREVTHDPVAVMALDAATAELLQWVIAGKIVVKGRRDGESWRLETIPPDDFPESFVGPLSVASIPQILGEAGPYVDISASSQITNGRRVFWSDLVVDGAELEGFLTNGPVSQSPKRKATKVEALTAIMRDHWQERPAMTANEMGAFIRKSHLDIGEFSTRTLNEAIARAWPKDLQNSAK